MNTKFIIVLTAVLASLLEIIDSSIVNVAMPHMQGNLEATRAEIAWVSTAYIIANAVILPVASWLGKRIGLKVYFTTCITIFTVTSMLCGMAPNLGTLIFFRVIQGFAGGALLPTSQALIQEQFTGAQAGIGSAIYGISIMMGPAIGPTLGGWLTDQYNWRFIFYINLPIGLLAGFLSFLFIGNQTKENDSAAKDPIDVWGFALLFLAVGCFQYVLERGQEDDWFHSNLIIAFTAIAAFTIPLFFAHEWNHKKPLVNVRLFKQSAVLNGTMLIALVGFALYSVNFIIPQYADQILHMDATQTGELFIPFALATMLTMPIVGALIGRVGAKPFISYGILMVSISFWQFAHFTTASGAGDIVRALICQGSGLACLFVPINASVLRQLEGDDLAQGTGILNLFRQLGGSIGLAAIGTFLDRFSSQFKNDLARGANYGNWAAHQAMQNHSAGQGLLVNVGYATQSSSWMQSASLSLKSIQGRISQQAFQLSFNRLMAFSMAVFLLSLIPLIRMKLKKPGTGAAVAQ